MGEFRFQEEIVVGLSLADQERTYDEALEQGFFRGEQPDELALPVDGATRRDTVPFHEPEQSGGAV